MKTGMIGLGAMGSAMAANVAKAGYLTAVWNRTTDKAELLAGRLAVGCASSVRDLAATTDVLLVCVSADEDVLDVVGEIAMGIRPGGIVVDLSTVSSDTAVEAAAVLAARQAAFLDAPVSGGVEGARNGALAMMVGGDAGVLEKSGRYSKR
ncbi:NAD(P)-dependent oxidoreductase [Thiolapillus sp.]|uniref:NAD(P)-dependent oxidoreductase n=1 Tax=Thiolapillus sp. TaxID=2017437 RepID=UPI003AF850AE